MDTFFLTNPQIDRISRQVTDFLTQAGSDKQNIVRTRLIAEEVLIRYQAEFGEDAPLTVNETRRLFRDSLVLTVEGRSYDPFSATDEQAILHRLLADIGIAPTWHYKNGKNIITISK